MFWMYLSWPATVNKRIEEFLQTDFTQRTLCMTNICMFLYSFIFVMEDCVFSGNLLQIKVCEWVQEQGRIRALSVVVLISAFNMFLMALITLLSLTKRIWHRWGCCQLQLFSSGPVLPDVQMLHISCPTYFPEQQWSLRRVSDKY